MEVFGPVFGVWYGMEITQFGETKRIRLASFSRERMPRVLVPVGLDDDGYNHGVGEINYARTAYLNKLIRYGLTPVMLSPHCTPLMVNDLYSLCDGVLLMGGDDVSAELYGESNHPRNKTASEKRDSLEYELVQRAIEDRKPVLGICRGCQMLAVASGGSLHQHLPDSFCDEPHGSPALPCYEEEVGALMHDVLIEPDSRCFGIAGAAVVRTNSSHHQAVNEPGVGFRIAGRTPAGVIELIEHEDPEYFCFGIQAHPEVQENSFFEQFFKAFARALTSRESVHPIA